MKKDTIIYAIDGGIAMISFINDYSECAHPRILELLTKTNYEQNVGYGQDVHCERAKTYIKKHLQRDDVDIHFIPAGTQTNLLVISAFLRSYQSVIAADTGHINVHETGAIEATGHKVIAMPAVDGKLTPAAILDALEYHTNEHMVQPKMVYISDTTELGTVYTKEELTAISSLCKEKELLFFLDGARLGSAMTCNINDLTMKDLAQLVDVFYIGGTKNGALLGEALVICKEELKADFRYMIKQRGAMMAKGFILGIQFEVLFQDGLFFELGKHSNVMAELLAKAFKDLGYSFYAPHCSNQLFPILPNEIIHKLEQEFGFMLQEKIDNNNSAVRFVTSWATKVEHVERFIEALKSITL
jgi:threonine aldolase